MSLSLFGVSTPLNSPASFPPVPLAQGSGEAGAAGAALLAGLFPTIGAQAPSRLLVTAPSGETPATTQNGIALPFPLLPDTFNAQYAPETYAVALGGSISHAAVESTAPPQPLPLLDHELEKARAAATQTQ